MNNAILKWKNRISYLLIMISTMFFNCDSNKIVTERRLNGFAKNVLREYKKIVDSNKDFPKYNNELKVYSEMPFKTLSVISKEFGVSISFESANSTSFKSILIDERIEDYNFTKGDRNFSEQELDNLTVFRTSNKGTLFDWNGRNGAFQNIVFIGENNEKFISLGIEANVYLLNCYLNGKFFQNTVLFGTNKNNFFTRKKAKEIANEMFFRDVYTALLVSSEFRKFYNSPILEEIAEEIVQKQNKGVYNAPLGALQFEEDLKRLRDKGKVLGVESKFVETIISIMENKFNRPNFFQRNPWFVPLLLFILTLIITYWKKLRSLLNIA